VLGGLAVVQVADGTQFNPPGLPPLDKELSANRVGGEADAELLTDVAVVIGDHVGPGRSPIRANRFSPIVRSG